jgi:hypothetical protein
LDFIAVSMEEPASLITELEKISRWLSSPDGPSADSAAVESALS